MIIKESLSLLGIGLCNLELSNGFVLLLILESIAKEAYLSLGLWLWLKLLILRLNGILGTWLTTCIKEACYSWLILILRLVSWSLSHLLLLRLYKTPRNGLLSHGLVTHRRLLSLVSSEEIGRLSSWLSGLLICLGLLLALEETLLSSLITLSIIPITLIPRGILLILRLITSTESWSIQSTLINIRLEILLVLSSLC